MKAKTLSCKLAFTFILFTFTTISFSQKTMQRYNVLLIVADDMNDYGFFKTNPAIITPNLDKFRKSAVSFRYAYCAAPACSPSRTAFLSGISPHKSGKYYNGSEVWNQSFMEKLETMPEYFQRIGYNTYGKGKLFHSQIPDERVDRNFMGGTGKAGFGPFPDEENRIGGDRFKGLQAFPDNDFPDVVNADEVIEILSSEQEKPFFLMYGLWRPHSPYTCPQRFYDMYNEDEIQIPKGYSENDLEDLPLIAQNFIQTKATDFALLTETTEQWKAYLKGYYACYTFADWNIGRVLDVLEKSKYAENTIVIVTSDNGFHMGEKNRFDKNSLWELSAITPMAVRVPGSRHTEEVCFKPVNLQDLYPTLVDYCGEGVTPVHEIDGHSIRPLLEDPQREWNYPSITYFGKGWVSIRSEQYRYLYYPDGTEELYDHKNDSWELTNLAEDRKYRKVIQQLRSHIPVEMAESLPGRWTTLIKKVEAESMK